MSENTQSPRVDVQAFIQTVTKDIPKDTGGKLKAERQALFADIESITAEMKSNPALLKVVLQKSASFPERSIGNVILIGKYKPEATLLKTFQDWKKDGAWVKADKPVKLMAKGKSYVDGNNRVRQSYNVCKYYDVADTGMKRQPALPKRKAVEYFQAMGANPPCKFQFYDDMPLNTLYVPENDTVYVKSDMKKQPEQCFTEIVGELSHRSQYLSDKQGYHRENPDTVFKSQCMKFIVAARCGMDTGKIDLPKELIPDAEPKALKGMLRDVHKDAASLYMRIKKQLPEIQRVQEPEKNTAKPPAKKTAKQDAPSL